MRQNLKYKLLALACAFALQRIYAAGEVKSVTFAVIRTQVVARDSEEPAGLKATLPEVAVQVQGPKRAIDGYLAQPDGGASAVTAEVNLKGLRAGTHSLPIKLSAKPPLEPVPGDPPLANVQLEKLGERTMTVQVVPQGGLSSDYRWESAQSQPNPVKVQGTAGVLANIARIEARVPAQQTTPEMESDVRVQAVDSRDQPVTAVTIEPDQVHVRVRIARVPHYKVVPVVLQTTGTPSAGFRIATLYVDPLAVTLSGSAKAVQDLQSISTEPVNLDGALQPVERVVKLRLPEGVEVVGVPSARVKVFFSSDTVTQP